MSRFQFTPDQRVTLLGQALRAFIPLKLETLPPRGKDKDGSILAPKALPGRLDQCAAAWAASTVDSLEWRIASDIEYHEKKAADARGKAGAA